MAGITGLAQALMNGPEYERPKAFTIMALEATAIGGFPRGIREFPWPENLNIERSATWNETEIAGGTNSFYTWGKTSGQTFTLELKLQRDIRPQASLPLLAKFTVNPQSPDNAANNRDIENDILFLSQFILPAYSQENGILVPKAPCYAVMQFSGMRTFYSESDFLVCVIESMSEEYVRLFPDGTVRVANISLSCKVTGLDTALRPIVHDRTNVPPFLLNR